MNIENLIITSVNVLTAPLRGQAKTSLYLSISSSPVCKRWINPLLRQSLMCTLTEPLCVLQDQTKHPLPVSGLVSPQPWGRCNTHSSGRSLNYCKETSAHTSKFPPCTPLARVKRTHKHSRLTKHPPNQF